MLNSILGNDPHILALNELHFFGRWIPNKTETWSRERAIKEAATLLAVARRSIWGKAPTQGEIEEAQQLVMERERMAPGKLFASVLSHLLHVTGKQIATDQTPRNIFFVKEILELFPNSKVVHLVRNPCAVLYSQRNRWRQRWLGAKNIPWWNILRVYANYHPYTTSKVWLKTFEAGEKVTGHERYLRVKFEDLVEHSEVTMRQMCQFLGIDYMPTLLDVPQVGSSNHPHTPDQRGITKNVVDTWRSQLPKADLWICQRMCKKVMVSMGYELMPIGVPVLRLMLKIMTFPMHLLMVMMANPRLAARIAHAMRRI